MSFKMEGDAFAATKSFNTIKIYEGHDRDTAEEHVKYIARR